MNEKPDEFLMHNRFLPKTDSFASIFESTEEEDQFKPELIANVESL
jgi:hypothetical protein